MARLNKIGLDYFPLDTDIELNDKIQLIESEFGLKGFAIIIKLFIKIYAGKGYFYEWGEKQRLLFARSLNENGCLVDDIVKRAVKWGIFNKKLFNNFQVLTSHSIQERYIEASLRRKSITFIKEYSLIKLDDVSKKINVNIKSINDDINSINVNINPQKEKESKVNEKENDTKENESSPHGDTPTKSFKEFNEKEFYQTLIPFVKEYGKEMIRSFYDYWTEKNASGKKMRFQLEKTWETAKRLSTWDRNESKFNKEKPQNKVETPKRKVYEL